MSPVAAPPQAPDVVGATEAAAILGVEVPRLTRWLESGKLPAPALRLAATPLWHRRTITRVAAGLPPVEELPLTDGEGQPVIVGLAEVAALLGKHKRQIWRWRDAGVFPEPYRELASGPIWRAEAVRGFTPRR